MFFQELLFTETDCKRILKLININNKISGDVKYSKKGLDVSFEEYKIEDNFENKWFLDTIKNFIYKNTKIKKVEFNIDASILKYGINDGFSKHIDLNISDENPRIYTVGLLLNTDFQGGNLIIYYKDDKILLNKKVGNCYLFESKIMHEVEKITKGIRYSLVIHIRRSEFQKVNLI